MLCTYCMANCDLLLFNSLQDAEQGGDINISYTAKTPQRCLHAWTHALVRTNLRAITGNQYRTVL